MHATVTAAHTTQQAGHWAEALQVLSEMQEHALVYDAVQYTAVIAACGKAGQWQSAIALHNRMIQQEGIPPTLQSYTAVLEVLLHNA
jgi:pentatricopeptide repeat protein